MVAAPPALAPDVFSLISGFVPWLCLQPAPAAPALPESDDTLSFLDSNCLFSDFLRRQFRSFSPSIKKCPTFDDILESIFLPGHYFINRGSVSFYDTDSLAWLKLASFCPKDASRMKRLLIDVPITANLYFRLD